MYILLLYQIIYIIYIVYVVILALVQCHTYVTRDSGCSAPPLEFTNNCDYSIAQGSPTWMFVVSVTFPSVFWWLSFKQGSSNHPSWCQDSPCVTVRKLNNTRSGITTVYNRYCICFFSCFKFQQLLSYTYEC